MKITISDTAIQMGEAAACCIADAMNRTIAEKGSVRIVVSTGSSQFEMFENLIAKDVDWTKVEMFHLDEYIGIPMSHPASFRKYLKERFLDKVPMGTYHFVEVEGNITENITKVSALLLEKPVDIGIIGIGENGHVAFNDPPADFDAQDPYIVVTLNAKCKAQQVREGWFADLDSVPKQAISMSVHQIMKCKKIISVVPHKVKAQAIFDTFQQPVNTSTPATILKQHPDWNLFVDTDAASLLKR